MARDDCSVCERHFPEGKGLTDGLCKACRRRRRELKVEAEGSAAAETEAGEE